MLLQFHENFMKNLIILLLYEFSRDMAGATYVTTSTLFTKFHAH